MTFRVAGLLAATLALAAGSAQAQDRMKVATTFTVIADMAREVAGDAADVVSITRPGAEVHGYQPTPRDIVGATYRANAEAYKAELAAALEPLRAEIAQIPEAQRWLVTCEGAFSYLARDLGLRELYLWPINADQMGTPRQVRTVIDTVRDNDIPAVFCESTVSQAPAQQVARETGAHYGGVLYVDSLSEPDGPVPSYLDLMRVTTRTIADGLAAGIAEQD